MACFRGGSSRGFCSRHTRESSRRIQTRRIRADLTCDDEESSSRELVKELGILPRDARLFATRGAGLAVRQAYYIFRFPPFAGCVTSEQAVLITDNGLPEASGGGYNQEVVKLACDMLEREIVEREADESAPQPFEHCVLDAVLREDILRKQDRFARISEQIEYSLAVRNRLQDANGAQRSRSVMGLLLTDTRAEAREHALYRLLTLADHLDQLQLEVRRAGIPSTCAFLPVHRAY